MFEPKPMLSTGHLLGGIKNLVIYGNVTRRARRMPIISDTSKLEGRLMAHFEATLILPTYNHFKTLFSVICGFTGLKTPKIRPKLSPKTKIWQ